MFVLISLGITAVYANLDQDKRNGSLSFFCLVGVFRHLSGESSLPAARISTRSTHTRIVDTGITPSSYDELSDVVAAGVGQRGRIGSCRLVLAVRLAGSCLFPSPPLLVILLFFSSWHLVSCSTVRFLTSRGRRSGPRAHSLFQERSPHSFPK